MHCRTVLYLEDHCNWGYKFPKWGYPSSNLLITLLTKSHEPLSRDTKAIQLLTLVRAATKHPKTQTEALLLSDHG